MRTSPASTNEAAFVSPSINGDTKGANYQADEYASANISFVSAAKEMVGNDPDIPHMLAGAETENEADYWFRQYAMGQDTTIIDTKSSGGTNLRSFEGAKFWPVSNKEDDLLHCPNEPCEDVLEMHLQRRRGEAAANKPVSSKLMAARTRAKSGTGPMLDVAFQQLKFDPSPVHRR